MRYSRLGNFAIGFLYILTHVSARQHPILCKICDDSVLCGMQKPQMFKCTYESPCSIRQNWLCIQMLQTGQKPSTCDRPGVFPNPESSNLFYNCTIKNDTLEPRTQSCPENTTFNTLTARCLTEEETNALNYIEKSIIFNPTNTSYQCQKPGTYEDKNDCKIFYICNEKLKPRVFSCSRGRYFNGIHCKATMSKKCVGQLNKILQDQTTRSKEIYNRVKSFINATQNRNCSILLKSSQMIGITVVNSISTNLKDDNLKDGTSVQNFIWKGPDAEKSLANIVIGNTSNGTDKNYTVVDENYINENINKENSNESQNNITHTTVHDELKTTDFVHDLESNHLDTKQQIKSDNSSKEESEQKSSEISGKEDMQNDFQGIYSQYAEPITPTPAEIDEHQYPKGEPIIFDHLFLTESAVGEYYSQTDYYSYQSEVNSENGKKQDKKGYVEHKGNERNDKNEEGKDYGKNKNNKEGKKIGENIPMKESKENEENKAIKESEENGENKAIIETEENGENILIKESEENGENKAIIETEENGENIPIKESEENGENIPIKESEENGENKAIIETEENGGNIPIKESEENGENIPIKESEENGENIPIKESEENGENIPIKENEENGENIPIKESEENGENIPIKESEENGENKAIIESEENGENIPIKESEENGENIPIKESEENGGNKEKRESEKYENNKEKRESEKYGGCKKKRLKENYQENQKNGEKKIKRNRGSTFHITRRNNNSEKNAYYSSADLESIITTESATKVNTTPKPKPRPQPQPRHKHSLPSFNCPYWGNFPHPNHCTKYFRCRWRGNRLVAIPEDCCTGKYFSRFFGMCCRTKLRSC